MKLKLEIEGIDQINRGLTKVMNDIESALGGAVKKGADVVRDDARSRINSISGTLARSITSMVTWDKNKCKAFAAVAIPNTYNDKFVVFTKTGTRYYIPTAVEYGHRAPGGVMNIEKRKKANWKGEIFNKKSKKKIKAKPFMRPAYKSPSNRAAVQKFVNDAVAPIINRGGD